MERVGQRGEVGSIREELNEPAGQRCHDLAPWLTIDTRRLVVAFGLTVTGLVVYAVGSELFSDNSPTSLYEHALEIVQNDKDLHDILQEPIKYHAESTGGRRHRRVRSSLSVDASGKEKMTVHFFAEGTSPDSHEEEGYLERAKRWIRPIVVEPMHESSVLVPTQPTSPPVAEKPAESTSSWLGSMFGSLLPSAFAPKPGSRVESGPPRMSTKPAKGTFATGEAVAIFRMSDDNKFKLDALTVYYPGKQRPIRAGDPPAKAGALADARQWQWKTDIVQGQRVQAAQLTQQEGPTRYRFWSRKA